MTEHRRSQRKRAHHAIQVVDSITGTQVGHVGNLSIDGMLLITSRKLPEDALFQFQFDLPSGPNAKAHQLEVGVHEQWCEAANVPGQYWSGFHIIDIAPEDYNVLYDWVMSPGGQLV